jgi:hypothetical protein
MLFAAIHMHPASQCPLNTADGKKMIKQLFSEENMKKSGIKLTSANMSCPPDTGADHKGYFIVEAKDVQTVKKFFGPMTVEVREVKPLSEVAKTL